jgi:hypothetical protein
LRCGYAAGRRLFAYGGFSLLASLRLCALAPVYPYYNNGNYVDVVGALRSTPKLLNDAINRWYKAAMTAAKIVGC